MNTPRPEHEQAKDARDGQADALLEAQLDALLAEEAELSRQTPAQLEAKVLALTDPRMQSLLDEALAPPEAPASLAERIVAATSPGAVARPRVEPSPRAVLARIGPAGGRYAAAAAIVLAAGVGMWWLGQRTEPVGEVARTPTPSAQPLEELFVAAQADPLFDDATDRVQTQIQAVAERIDGYAIDRESIWSDMDEYEQFLSDLET
ncbi:MAG: hypothetical protein ACE37H_00150 [Phycisphaeraceae bacterium]